MNHMKQSCRGGLGGIRSVTAFIANIAVSLALIAVLPIMVIWPFGGSHRPTVEVHDEAGILRTEPLAKKIQDLTWLIVGWLGCLGAGCCWDCGGCVGWGAH